MFELYGIRTDHFQTKIGGPFESSSTRDLLATFSSESAAKQYVKNSSLVTTPNSSVNISRGRYRFRKGSLLRYYEDFEITSSETVCVPHDPKIQIMSLKFEVYYNNVK